MLNSSESRVPRYFIALAVALAAFPSARVLPAQNDSAVTTLKPVTVTVTRGSGRTVLGSPFAITIAEPDRARPGQRHGAIDETLALIPGIAAINRSNPAQDARLSIRGFGARSAFGVRGIRVLRDGMPMTLPDGQTPLDYVSLESIGRVEVLRGAASALYGNASGGVIDLRSREPSPSPISLEARQWLGSNSLARSVLAASGTFGGLGYVADVAHSRSDGARAHSVQRSTTGFARGTLRAGNMEYSLTGLTLVNPRAENPGALTREEMQRDPEIADALSVRRNARKSVNQIQIGASAARSTKATDVSLSIFGGARSLDNPLTFAVVEVGRHSWGTSGLVRARRNLFGSAHSFAAGFDTQAQNDLRRNFAACRDTVAVATPTAMCPNPGSDRGIVTLDQRELISSVGLFLSDEVGLHDRVTLTAGVRGDRVRFEVQDRLVSATNSDDSGARSLNAVSPVAGIVARVAATHSVYANLSTAFETPTATELGNREDGSAGINPALDPQRSVTGEAGAKGWVGSALKYDVSVFRTGVRDELIPFEIPASNGRRYFRNAGRTDRIGAELGADLSIRPVTLMVAYAWSRFRFDEYRVGADDFGGNTIPGIPSSRLQSALRIERGGTFVLIENEYAGNSWLDDANTVRGDSYSVTGIRLGITALRGTPRLSVTTGIQNVLNRRYASSLAVNAARGRYFEPAPPRNFYAGITVGGPGR
ncbi:MAG TPA: TonB-dependent receptor [Gemmatimonadaceae bacterium]